jgi:hypothetical protein
MCHCDPPALSETDIACIGDGRLLTTKRTVDGDVLLCLNLDVIDHARPRRGSASDDPVDGPADESSGNGLRCAHVAGEIVRRAARKSIRGGTMAGEETQDFLPQASTNKQPSTELPSKQTSSTSSSTTTKPKPSP